MEDAGQFNQQVNGAADVIFCKIRQNSSNESDTVFHSVSAGFFPKICQGYGANFPPKWPSVNPSKWANLKSNFLKFRHRNQVISGIEKPRKTLIFRGGIRLASLEKPSVFLGHGLRPMTSNEKKLRLMQAWAKLFIFDVAWLMAIA